jgi:hypothetical protein
MCVSRSFFSSPRPSWILDTRLYMRPKSERRWALLCMETNATYLLDYVFILRKKILWNKTAVLDFDNQKHNFNTFFTWLNSSKSNSEVRVLKKLISPFIMRIH